MYGVNCFDHITKIIILYYQVHNSSNRKTTMKQTIKTYRVTVTGSEDTVIMQLERTTAERAKKYAVAYLLKIWGPDAEIDSVDVELQPA